MNTKNLEFLNEGLKYLGFDPKLGLEMARHMQDGTTEFQLQANTNHFKDEMKADLHFKKSATHDMYFLNKYDATLRKEDGSTRNQTFYINKNAGVTFKEAYNLLSGRAVNKDLQNKEGEKYNAWIQLDFDQKDKYDNNKVKQYNQNYGYDLGNAVAKHPVKELQEPEQKERLMKSLEKGNVQSVTFAKDGNEERMYIEANPQFKTVNVFDSQMKKVYQENTAKVQQQAATVASPGDLKNKKPRQSAKADETPSMQKKKQSRGKGMRM